MKYVGIDVHKKMCQVAVLDEEGKLLDEIRFANDPEEIEEFADKLTTFHDDVKAVVESTGNLWIQIHDRLEEHGFDVALSNPAKTRLIAEAKVKTDKVDARTLAALLRADMIPTCYVPGEEIRSRRELLRHRVNLVKNRTMVKNRIHGILDKHGLRMPGVYPFSRGNITWLRGLSLGFMDDAILRSDLALLEALSEQVDAIEEKIAVIAAEERQVRLLMTMTGVGYFTAMLILSEVGDIGRFRSEKAFASWMGLAPMVRQSGERTWVGGVPRQSNGRLKSALVECAQTAVRYDARFRGMHERVSRRRGSGCATVAVAHEMARIMYFMLSRNETYRGADVGLVERKLKDMDGRAMIGLRN
ncbi:MAG: IS110 family transposase [Candidatus Bathyarchaeota archaeon]|nr:IS110 family transposase [Candidatus Bathyarchaeota archaeon]